ncbi:unnamed protein product [Linum tenue]|uniref:Uncharacterized protein n=1 Tax=Linum tenue TaxID=586396 RepID=A0AAV0M8D1_9ROSI|nr:unnamed protein product [Linum tenue]
MIKWSAIAIVALSLLSNDQFVILQRYKEYDESNMVNHLSEQFGLNTSVPYKPWFDDDKQVISILIAITLIITAHTGPCKNLKNMQPNSSSNGVNGDVRTDCREVQRDGEDGKIRRQRERSVDNIEDGLEVA